jgi:hypothetical protein
MSRYLSNDELNDIERMLSAPRLGTYVSLVRSGQPQDAIELHQATMTLGIAIMAVTGLIEVALRNSVCHELNQTHGGEGWLRSPPSDLTWSAYEIIAIKRATSQAQRAAYSKMLAAEKSALDAVAFPAGVPPDIKHRKLAQKRQATITVSDGQVIAQLTMSFWKRLFSDHYEKTLWKRSLKKVFPNKTIDRPHIASQLETIYEIRNRLAHHEPVYGTRLEAVLDAIDFFVTNIGSRVPSSETAFAKLTQPQLDVLSGQVAIFRKTFERLVN